MLSSSKQTQTQYDKKDFWTSELLKNSGFKCVLFDWTIKTHLIWVQSRASSSWFDLALLLRTFLAWCQHYCDSISPCQFNSCLPSNQQTPERPRGHPQEPACSVDPPASLPARPQKQPTSVCHQKAAAATASVSAVSRPEPPYTAGTETPFHPSPQHWTNPKYNISVAGSLDGYF